MPSIITSHHAIGPENSHLYLDQSALHCGQFTCFSLYYYIYFYGFNDTLSKHSLRGVE